MRVLSIITFCVVMLSLATSEAAIIYDSGPPDFASGNTTTRLADDFTTGSASTLRFARFWVIEAPGALDTLSWGVWSDSPGSPGTQLASGNAINVVHTGSTVPWPGNPATGNLGAYTFELDTPFALSAGTTYWFELEIDDNNGSNGHVFWTTAPPPFGGNSHRWSFGWSFLGQNFAFVLADSALPPLPAFGGPVPEPSTLALGLMGMALVAGRWRRRSLKSAQRPNGRDA